MLCATWLSSMGVVLKNCVLTEDAKQLALHIYVQVSLNFVAMACLLTANCSQ